MGRKIKQSWNKIICTITGCKWLFNFVSMPSRAICERCNAKSNFNPKTLNWEKTDSFPPELGSDEEIKKRWFSYTK